MRLVAMAVLAAMFAIAGGAHAAVVPFDPEAATQAWLATLGPQATARSNSYFEGGYLIEFAGVLISVLIAAALLFSGSARGVRTWLEKTVKFYPLVVFGMAVFFIVVSTVVTFPFTYYVDFVREHAFGLSTQSFSAWFGEQMAGAAIGLVLGAIFLTLLYLIIRAAKTTWWIWGSAASIAFAAIVLMASPVYIDPMFNTYTPMQEGELRDDILAMAQANGVPADDVYVYDRSRQSNSISANVSGLFGTTRIALADTLLERGSPDVVRAVMAHEIGHYVLGHIFSIMVMMVGLILITFAAIHFCFRQLTKGERWGVRDISDPAGLPLFVLLAAVVGLFTAPLQRNITYFHEQQADMFGLNAARAPDGFAQAAVMLSEYRKMQPSPLEEWFFYDHPSGSNRVRHAMVWKAHEIAAGRLEPSPGGPPRGWVPDFVRAAASPSPEPSPDAASD